MDSSCLMTKPCHSNQVKHAQNAITESDQKLNEKQRQSQRGRKIGYVRVSDADQSEALQIDALKAAGCSTLYRDHGISGAKKARPALDKMMAKLKAGDTLTVWKLDRLGRSTIHLLSILEDLSLIHI